VHRKGERFKIGDGIIGHVAATGETYYAPDVLSDPFYQVSEPLTRSSRSKLRDPTRTVRPFATSSFAT
jgi:hypothetical protein